MLMLNVESMIYVVLFIMNLLTFVLFYIDKRRAVARKRNRISERTLLIASFLGGGIGGLLGMYGIRHKTKHLRFQVLVPIAAVVTVIIFYFV